ETADISDPAHPSKLQLDYIKGYVDAAEQALAGDGEAWRQYFDVPALIDWYLVNELLRNHDARLATSVYLQKRRGGPLVFGPLWDFDIAAGNINFSDNERTDGWWVRSSAWHRHLFARPAFGREVFTRWCAL